MFTGIVRGLCGVLAVHDEPGLRTIEILLGRGLDDRLETGASIAINGTCLTVVRFQAAEQGTVVVFQCIQETLDRTNLGRLVVGDRVNVERAMRYGDEVGGHQVFGHVDCVGTISEVIETPNNHKIFVSFDTVWAKYLVPKGWITIDGVSLTVVDVRQSEGQLSVSLIPETLARTTLGFKSTGSQVNLEFDGGTKTAVLTMERLLPTMIMAWQGRP